MKPALCIIQALVLFFLTKPGTYRMISNLSFMQFLLFVSIIISLSCVPAFVVVMFCMLLASLHFLLVALPRVESCGDQ